MYNSYSALNLLGGMLYTVILLVVAYFCAQNRRQLENF